jgi:transposase-like protein
MLDATPKSQKDDLYSQVRAILDAPDLETTRLLLAQALEAFETKEPKAMRILESGFDDVTAVLALPEKYRRRLRTTNSVERLNEEIRRRERVIRIFPNRQSVSDYLVPCSWTRRKMGRRTKISGYDGISRMAKNRSRTQHSIACDAHHVGFTWSGGRDSLSWQCKSL